MTEKTSETTISSVPLPPSWDGLDQQIKLMIKDEEDLKKAERDVWIASMRILGKERWQSLREDETNELSIIILGDKFLKKNDMLRYDEGIELFVQIADRKAKVTRQYLFYRGQWDVKVNTIGGSAAKGATLPAASTQELKEVLKTIERSVPYNSAPNSISPRA